MNVYHGEKWRMSNGKMHAAHCKQGIHGNRRNFQESARCTHLKLFATGNDISQSWESYG